MVRIIQRRIKSVQSGGLDNNVLQYLHNITFDDRTSILGEGGQRDTDRGGDSLAGRSSR